MNSIQHEMGFTKHKVGKPSTLNEAHQKLFSPLCGQLQGWDAACLEAEVSLQIPQCHLETHLKMHSVTQAQTRTLTLCVVINVITSDLGHRFTPWERRFPSFYVFRLSTNRIPTGNHKLHLTVVTWNVISRQMLQTG